MANQSNPGNEKKKVNNLLIVALSIITSNKLSENEYLAPDEERNKREVDAREQASRKPKGKNKKKAGAQPVQTADSVPAKKVNKIKGIYQLDPVPRYLHKVVGGLDGVLMIQTKQTRDIEANQKEVTITRKDKKGESIIETRTITPEGYFLETLAELETPQRPIEKMTDCVLQEGDTATQGDIDRILDKIRGYCERHKDEDVRIFIDLHGGPRANVQLMTAIISLLPLENTAETTATEGIRILPENIYTVIYNPPKRPNPRSDQNKDAKAADADKQEQKEEEKSRILCAGTSYDIMDLVAGVHECVEYGRTESLIRYKNRGHQDIEPMVNALDEISDALAMANIEGFENGLDHLGKAIDVLKEAKAARQKAAAAIASESDSETNQQEPSGTQGAKDATSDILLSLVDQEYKDIIKSNKTWEGTVQKIRWCMDKKFYQLAITMCEAQIPWSLHDKHVFDMTNAISTGFGQTKRMEGKEQEQFLGAFNFFVTSYEFVDRGSKGYFSMQWDSGWKSDGKCYYLESTGRDSGLVDHFLNLHNNIKETRNTANHLLSYEGGTKRGKDQGWTVYKTRTELEAAIDDYLKTVKQLIDHHVQLSIQVADEQTW